MKTSLRFGSLAVLAFLSLVIVSSLVVVNATSTSKMFDSIESYSKYSKYLTAKISDERLLQIYEDRVDRLSPQDKESLSTLSNSEILTVARGERGSELILRSLSEDEKSAVNSLLNILSDDLSSPDGEVIAGLWGGNGCPVLTGSCTPGHSTCRDRTDGGWSGPACEYTCTAGGTWGTGSECPWATCHTNQACQPNSLIIVPVY